MRLDAHPRQLKPGADRGRSLKYTIKDVARVAGVSLGTASRVMNGSEKVGPQLRSRVLDAVEQLGYRPNEVARSMRLNATQAIAILIRDIDVPGFSSFIKSAQAMLYKAGYVLMLAITEGDRDRELGVLNALARRRIDGLIVSTVSDSDEALASAREEIGVPIVLLDREQRGRADTVLIGHREGARQAVKYLLELGHRRIAMVTGSLDTRPARERFAGYRDAFDAAQVPIDSRLVRGQSYSPEYAFIETSALLNDEVRPTAIIAGGVAMLPAVLRAIAANNLRVPDDISVIGTINSELAELSAPPVTVVDVDYATIGAAAAQLLLDRLNGRLPDPTPRRLMFATTLLIRQSCCPPR